MRDFFKPLRRKIGVVTLGLACVFAWMLIRSLTVIDSIEIDSWLGFAESIVSSDGLLSWEHRDLSIARRNRLPIWTMGTQARRRSIERELELPVYFRSKPIVAQQLNAPKINWYWRWNGFGSGILPSSLTTFWVIPYWSIVLPLTLLSAYLLFSKPRQMATKPTTEPAPTTGA